MTSDVGCDVTFSPSGYTICADRDIAPGEEVSISYGNHSNDFLLAEYGFILAENRWDEIRLDDILIELIDPQQLAGSVEPVHDRLPAALSHGGDNRSAATTGRHSDLL